MLQALLPNWITKVVVALDMKRLDKGAFILPAPTESGASYVIMRPAMLPRLFRA